MSVTSKLQNSEICLVNVHSILFSNILMASCFHRTEADLTDTKDMPNKANRNRKARLPSFPPVKKDFLIQSHLFG